MSIILRKQQEFPVNNKFSSLGNLERLFISKMGSVKTDRTSNDSIRTIIYGSENMKCTKCKSKKTAPLKTQQV